jgi:hypothetical protein
MILPTTEVQDRDVMFTPYNDIGMYGTKPIPDENSIRRRLALGGAGDRDRLSGCIRLGFP